MLNALIVVAVVLFYTSLLVELLFYNIPSVVATRKILNPNLIEKDTFSETFQKKFAWPLSYRIVVFFVPLIFVICLHLLPLFYGFQLIFQSKIISSSWLIFCGIGLVWLGRVISHWYLITIEKIKKQKFKDFTTTGIFKYSRNPGLLGLYVSFLGFLFIFPTIFNAICLLIYIVHMHIKVLMEEDYLRNKHKQPYQQYLKKTNRYL